MDSCESTKETNSSDSGNDSFVQLYAQEVNALSAAERELCSHELNGVDRIYTETPAFVSGSLAALDKALKDIKGKNAFVQALRLSRDYVQCHKFRLAFLRAERFRARRAAFRMVQFLEWKLRTFGEDKLTEPILFTEHNAEAQEALRSGCFQILPSRDRSGRVVLCCDFRSIERYQHTKEEVASLTKALNYIMLVVAEDEESQRRGMVAIFYEAEWSRRGARRRRESRIESDDDGLENRLVQSCRPGLLRGGSNRGGFRSSGDNVAQDMLSEVFALAPIHICGAHFCWQDPLLTPLAHLILANAGREFRIRARLHHFPHTYPTVLPKFSQEMEGKEWGKWAGNGENKKGVLQRDDLYHSFKNIEEGDFSKSAGSAPEPTSLRITQQNVHGTYWQLRSFGIPVELLPIAADGTLKTNTHEDWLARRKSLELHISRFQNLGLDDGGVDLPAKFDVLVGRGRPFQQHVGNLVLRALVDKNMSEYLTTRQGYKWTVCQNVLNAIRKHSGGRFLRKGPDGLWYTISDTEALDKVTKTFLTSITKMNKR